jgi:uncharacterized protein (DUF488 family)
MTTGDSSVPVLYTIGHSNQTTEQFIALLKQHDIQVLVDVRSAPYSRYVPHFNTRELQTTIREAGLPSISLGQELGGRPDPATGMYDEDGRALYYRVAESDAFKRGIRRLRTGIERHRVAIMCSEEDPTDCHRRRLVAKVLVEDGVRVLHIRGNGEVEPETTILSEYRKPVQQSLFGESTERDDNPWRSTLSVLPRSPQRDSSDS